MKQCSKCKILKDTLLFHKSTSYKDGLYPSCKECKNHKNSLYRSLNKESIELYYKAAKWVELILEEQIDVDHIIPLRGRDVRGLHVPWNLQLLIRILNKNKGINYE